MIPDSNDPAAEPRRRRFFRNAALGLGALVGGGAARRLGAAEPARSADPFVGEIISIPYNFAPRGFVFCEGQTLSISQNNALFSLIGTYYGGDGRTTFQLPDTRPVEAAAKKDGRASRPPFRYAIAITGIYPSRA